MHCESIEARELNVCLQGLGVDGSGCEAVAETREMDKQACGRLLWCAASHGNALVRREVVGKVI